MRRLLTILTAALAFVAAPAFAQQSTGGTVARPAPVNADQVAGRDASGNLRVPKVDSSGNLYVVATSSGGTATCTDNAGVYCSPKAAAADRVITKTSVSANTSTTVCPAISSGSPVTTEIQVANGTIGLGFKGQALTAAVLGTTTADPDLVMGTALSYYVFPVAPTNAITAYGSAQVVTCIQTMRQ